jgi:membrane associated rhomboid family serine protease
MSSFSRFPRSGSSWGQYITPAIRNLVIACTGALLIETLLLYFDRPVYAWMIHEFGLMPMGTGFRPWQLVSYLFLHDGLMHLLFNMLFLWMFGVDLERTWGTQRFYSYFFLTGIGGGCINILVKLLLDPSGLRTQPIPTVGASGAIYGILLAAAVMFPDRKVWLIPFPVTIPMKMYVLAAGAIEFFSTWQVGGDNVSHVTHLGGMLVGYLYLRRGSWFYRARNGVTDWKQKRARRKFEVYMRKHRDEPPSRPDHWVN